MNGTSAPRNFLNLFSHRHYHGDMVRRLFVVAAVTIFLSIPFEDDFIFSTKAIIIVTTVVLILFAGLTSPRQLWVAIADAIIAALGSLFFELLAIRAFETVRSLFDFMFLSRQFLAVVLLLAFYFSMKTVRGMSIPDRLPEPPLPSDPPHPLG